MDLCPDDLHFSLPSLSLSLLLLPLTGAILPFSLNEIVLDHMAEHLTCNHFAFITFLPHFPPSFSYTTFSYLNKNKRVNEYCFVSSLPSHCLLVSCIYCVSRLVSSRLSLALIFRFYSIVVYSQPVYFISYPVKCECTELSGRERPPTCNTQDVSEQKFLLDTTHNHKCFAISIYFLSQCDSSSLCPCCPR